MWSVVVGFLSVGCMAISGEINDIAAVNNLFTAFSLALCCNFIVVTLMCLKRIDVRYQVISRFWGGRSKGHLASFDSVSSRRLLTPSSCRRTTGAYHRT